MSLCVRLNPYIISIVELFADFINTHKRTQKDSFVVPHVLPFLREKHYFCHVKILNIFCHGNRKSSIKKG